MALSHEFQNIIFKSCAAVSLAPAPARRPAPMPDPVRWGPDNPHPLSQMRTELVWDGKHDEDGRRRNVDVAGAAMPMQKIETVDMPRSEALASGQTTLGELSTTLQEDHCSHLH